MALMCEQSAFILPADDASSACASSQLCFPPEPFDPSVFALLMAWPSTGHNTPAGGSSTGSSRGGNTNPPTGTPLSPLSGYDSTRSTPPSRLTPASSTDSLGLSYASSASAAGGPGGLDNATRTSAVAEFQLLHPSGRADDASPYSATTYGYRHHAHTQSIEEDPTVGLYSSSRSDNAPSAFSTTTTGAPPPPLRGTGSSASSSPQANYYASPSTLYPVSPPQLLSPSWGQPSLCDFQQSFESGPTGSYDPATYGSLGGSGPSPYATPSGQMTSAVQFNFPHGGTGTPSNESANDPSPSPQSSGSESPSLTAQSGSSSGLSRHRSSSRAYNDPATGFMAPMAHIRKRPRRKAEEIERIYTCNFEGCQKSYGTLNHLNAHVRNANHGEKRRPEQFREIRNEWKRRKAQEAQEAMQAAAAAEQRQRASGSGMAGPSSMRPPYLMRRPTDDYTSQGFFAHRQEHAPGLGLPPTNQPLGLSRLPGPIMTPQGYYPPALPSAGLSPYSSRGPATPWTPTDRPMISPSIPYVESHPQDQNQAFGQPIRLPPAPAGFHPAQASRGPPNMPDYPSRQGSSAGYPPRDQSRQ